MKVILSCGLGPLHFVSSAQSIVKEVDNLSFICGYVPPDEKSGILRFLAFLRGKKLTGAIRKRQIHDAKIKVCSCCVPEFLNQGLLILDRCLHGVYRKLYRHIWSFFGWCSKRYLRGADIFHVRSGAGQGGAIKRAKQMGMKVLVDHSALHPATSKYNLQDECNKYGLLPTIDPDVGVWRNVLRDCNEADMIVVNAFHIRDSFIEHGYPASKLRVVYLGVRDDFRGLKKDYSCDGLFRVLFTGGFIILKGAEYILESLKILVDRGIKVRYDIVGGIGAPKSLMNKYDGLPIVYHGQKPQDELKEFLANSDCYLFPSLADGCAQSGMEALTAGLPVVATYQSGLPITDGETGFVVPMKDAKAIADKIEWLILHPEQRACIGKNAAKMMRENYTWGKYAENMRKVYEELLLDR